MLGYIAVICAVIIWGLSYIVMKTAAADYPQVLFQFWRYAAVTAICVVCFYPSVKRIPALLWKKGLLRLGLANFTLSLFSIYAVQHTTPTRVVVINSLIIGVVPLLRRIHYNCRPNVREKWAVGISLAAFALMLSPGDFTLRLGDGLALAGMLGYAYSIVIMDRLLTAERSTVIQVSFLGVAGSAVYFTMAAIGYALFSPEWSSSELLPSQPGTLAGIAYMVVFVSFAANLLQSLGQRKLPPVTVSILFCMEPAFTALLDYTLLGNRPSAAVILCGLLLVGATSIVSVRKREKGLINISERGDGNRQQDM
ncbi:DMT family transporter [Paenibacillus contaminans]|uniref:EamA domain-containing protein n=1 Tax=Paenibacillus contaminans TaxID=450362 RepID=A0A329MNU7_9BACL|nr:DMT family transporter [Paenibacillus contaminans]RAV21569.1 hypothetical protein DQG23_09915 [Paenibacillus contaminans]